jgi:hypothetical protein
MVPLYRANKDDILTQSQIFKDPEKTQFIESQVMQIVNLIKTETNLC